MSERIVQPTIPEPYQDVKSLRATSMALKEAVEILMGQRGDGTEMAVTWQDVTDRGFDQVTPFRINGMAIIAAGTYKYTKSVGLRYLRMQLWGGGAGSQAMAATSSTQINAAAGGGAGSYCEKWFRADSLDDNEDIIIGQGGAAGTASVAPGNGGDSKFKEMTAGGGAGNGQVAAVAIANSPGNGYQLRAFGGVATGGDINLTGGGSDNALLWGGFAMGGAGGIAPMAAGRNPVRPAAGGSNQAARAGYAPGGGASGGASSTSQAAANGAIGADGWAIMTEYY